GDHMKTFLLSIAACLLVGCAATRPVSEMIMGGGGAALAHELSNGDPAITAAGAAGGVLVSEGLHYANRKQTENVFANGYEKGRSDAVKQQYWILVNQQKANAGERSKVRLYEIPIPEQNIDG